MTAKENPVAQLQTIVRQLEAALAEAQQVIDKLKGGGETNGTTRESRPPAR